MPDDLDCEKDLSVIPWWQKIILRVSPKLFLKYYAKKIYVNFADVEFAEKLFFGKRIDIQPLSGVTGRGFIVFIDKKLSLWFDQDGDHFKFDGYEMGEYGGGKVTIFDGIGR